jgi:hypothetical protein
MSLVCSGGTVKALALASQPATAREKSAGHRHGFTFPCRQSIISAMPSFTATIAILGVNPYVRVPERQLKRLFVAAGRDKGPIPITVTLKGKDFKQTLVRYRGDWRLYLNTPMRETANKRVGDRVTLTVEFDPNPRVQRMPTAFRTALRGSQEARRAYDDLPPSRKSEILRYLNHLKTKASLERNVRNVVGHLTGAKPATLGALMRAPK